MECFRCKTQDHYKLGVYLCESCYLGDPVCTNQQIRYNGVCPYCLLRYGKRGGQGWVHTNKCKSDKCQY